MYAHYFNKTARKPAEVIITTGPALNTGVVFQSYVSGKADARRRARAHNAQPWNF